MNSREAAFLALLHSLRGERYISDYLEDWFIQEKPHAQDYHLAQQIAYGSAQMALALDFLALQVSEKKKIHLKLKEKALLRTALYQIYFLNRIPHYAIVDETIKVAKNYFHKYFVSYLNAILRKSGEVELKLPQHNDASSLSIRYSFPILYVSELMHHYGEEKTLEILRASNHPAVTMARLRNPTHSSVDWISIIKDPLPVVIIPPIEMFKIVKSADFYIQNVTPVQLMSQLCEKLTIAPQVILDMCAAPGGKSLAVHDFFPEAQLFANDVSEDKLIKLKENFQKYEIQAHVLCNLGQDIALEEKFDLIILDVPCSNSGVLNKRPEARWRLNEENSQLLEKTQWALLEKAKTLLKPHGQIWYMTCSILPHENEKMVDRACRDLGFKELHRQLILPNLEGWDGGFASALKIK